MNTLRQRLLSRLRPSVPLLALATGVLAGCAPEAPEPERRPMSLSEAMSPGDTAGFRRAEEPRELSFPDDHGPHPGFQTEWWYLVGNLRSPERRFGYQITFFRSTLRPPGPQLDGAADAAIEPDSVESSWSTDDVFMAHLAVTDIDGGRFHAFERFSRAAAGLAGVEGGPPFGIWLDDWRIESTGESTLPLRLSAAEDGVELDLLLQAGKPPVLQGDRGLSRKGATPGNASYYYSLTRLPTSGTLRIGGESFSVEGASWMDREWSTSALEEGQVGWDWFALQLSDGRDLMAYRMRREGDTTDPHSSGVIVEVDGAYRPLAVDEYDIEVLDHWTSPKTGSRYPAGWRLTSRVAAVDLALEPLLSAQEHDATVVYWEGAVSVSGRSLDQPVGGQGYVELTGYRQPPS